MNWSLRRVLRYLDHSMHVSDKLLDFSNCIHVSYMVQVAVDKTSHMS